MSYYELIVLGLVCLVTPWLAKLAGYEIARKPFDLVGIGGVFFLLASAFGLGMNLVESLRGIGSAFQIVTIVLGWLALSAGAVWGTLDVMREPNHGLTRSRA
jgi:hypothetical protein